MSCKRLRTWLVHGSDDRYKFRWRTSYKKASKTCLQKFLDSLFESLIVAETKWKAGFFSDWILHVLTIALTAQVETFPLVTLVA